MSGLKRSLHFNLQSSILYIILIFLNIIFIFIYLNISATPVNNSTGSLIICCVSFCIITFYLQCFFRFCVSSNDTMWPKYDAISKV
jgi:hypothetical protein